MNWTTDKPTEAGWTAEPKREGVYWFRWDKDRDAIIVVVLMEYGDWRVMEMGHQYSGALTGYRSGEFLGPITPDDYLALQAFHEREEKAYKKWESDTFSDEKA